MCVMFEEIKKKELLLLWKDFPQVAKYITNYGINIPESSGMSLEDYLNNISEETYEEIGIDRISLFVNIEGFVEKNEASRNVEDNIKSITIIGGYDKSGNKEDIEFELTVGSITGIVGPTGSGKSRLLADIEWMADKDTPTGRQILINGKIADKKSRFDPQKKLVAQLSQNMNFVMDASVGEFIQMHAESRFVTNADKAVKEVICNANKLAGESFSETSPLTSLSGGQSRALMIADVAFLSSSPIILIDEIENAGIDRKMALSLLVDKEKIVLISTHDPILALLADKRIVISNGGISQIIQTSEEEISILSKLENLDNKVQSLRNQLRRGEKIKF